MPGFLDRLRGKAPEEPLDMDERSAETGLKYKDLLLLGQMMQQGADLKQPRHALYYLYFGTREVAEEAATEGRAAGYSCEVREPLPDNAGQWSMLCERDDVVLDPKSVREADDLFEGIATRFGGDFDGWEAAV
jgi:hypothetical protein